MTEARRIALALGDGARAAIEASRGRIDDLNVYPVPDGDTGSNLAETVRALADGLHACEAEDAAGLARAATRATLMGARGNSGIILSQIVRGVAEVLGGHETVDSAVLARALRQASDSAYRAVRQPVEGTMLTAVREMAEAAEREAGRTLDAALDAVAEAGGRAVEETPKLLAVLREAGVVDAGAAGLVECFRGAVAGLRGEPAEPSGATVHALPREAIHVETSEYRYCTTFLVEGDRVDSAALERLLEPLGDCLLVVGELPQYKVHVHTDDPGAALSAAVAMGEIEGVEIANMHRQTEEREERLAERPRLELVPGGGERATALVAVVAGDGNADLFRREAGAEIVQGGQTMNPSTGDILAAIRRAGAPAAIVLPNNKNVVMAAEQAAAEAVAEGIRASVVPTRSIAAGLALAVGFDGAADHDRNVAELEELHAAVRFGELTRAVRAATLDGRRVAAGEFIALVDGRLVAAGEDARAVAERLLDELLRDGGEVVTLLRGAEDAFAVEEWAHELGAERDGLEVTVHRGGQPHYPLLVAVE
jgi:DAK2 domain fusion protein YloV